MCSGRMSGAAAMSAIVRASLMIRVQARAESPILSMILSNSCLLSELSGQYLSMCLLLMAALQKIPSPSNRFL